MPGRTIHQLYCTHCTHGTSALQRDIGTARNEAYGYGVRAGSVSEETIDDVLRSIEPVLYFHLSGDTPALEMLKLTADTAQRRFIYFPSIGGRRVLAHISYRQTDACGRPGSYFAHVLIEEHGPDAPAWSPLDCLRLWNAAWTQQDSVDIPFDLPALSALDDLTGFGDAINDTRLMEFLTTPAGGDFTDRLASDPRVVIPERCRAQSADERCQLFSDVLSAAFNLDLDRRERLLIGIEPSLAALLFYGIMRLTPAGPWRDRLSFSTFESHSDRPAATFGATDFFNRAKADFSPEAYRVPGTTINTFNGRTSGPGRPNPYAVLILNRLLDPARGLADVDDLLGRLGQTAAQLPAEWGQYVEADELSLALVQPKSGALITDQQLPASAELRGYLRSRVICHLQTIPQSTPQERAALGSAEHMQLLLELLDGGNPQPAPDAEAIAQRLLAALPDAALPQLLADANISRGHRRDRLVRYLKKSAKLPVTFDVLWSTRSADAGAGDLLKDTFKRLDARTLGQIFEDLILHPSGKDRNDAARWKAAFRALLQAVPKDGEKRALIVYIFEHENLTGPQRDLLLGSDEIVELLVKEYPSAEPVLPGYLLQLLNELPTSGPRFHPLLELLKRCKSLLPAERAPEVAAWNEMKLQLQKLDELQQVSPGVFNRFLGTHLRVLEEAEVELGAIACRALPDELHPDDSDGKVRTSLVLSLARQASLSHGLPAGYPARLAAVFAGQMLQQSGVAASLVTTPAAASAYGNASSIPDQNAPDFTTISADAPDVDSDPVFGSDLVVASTAGTVGNDLDRRNISKAQHAVAVLAIVVACVLGIYFIGTSRGNLSNRHLVDASPAPIGTLPPAASPATAGGEGSPSVAISPAGTPPLAAPPGGKIVDDASPKLRPNVRAKPLAKVPEARQPLPNPTVAGMPVAHLVELKPPLPDDGSQPLECVRGAVSFELFGPFLRRPGIRVPAAPSAGLLDVLGNRSELVQLIDASSIGNGGAIVCEFVAGDEPVFRWVMKDPSPQLQYSVELCVAAAMSTRRNTTYVAFEAPRKVRGLLDFKFSAAEFPEPERHFFAMNGGSIALSQDSQFRFGDQLGRLRVGPFNVPEISRALKTPSAAIVITNSQIALSFAEQPGADRARMRKRRADRSVNLIRDLETELNDLRDALKESKQAAADATKSKGQKSDGWQRFQAYKKLCDVMNEEPVTEEYGDRSRSASRSRPHSEWELKVLAHLKELNKKAEKRIREIGDLQKDMQSQPAETDEPIEKPVENAGPTAGPYYIQTTIYRVVNGLMSYDGYVSSGILVHALDLVSGE